MPQMRPNYALAVLETPDSDPVVATIKWRESKWLHLSPRHPSDASALEERNAPFIICFHTSRNKFHLNDVIMRIQTLVAWLRAHWPARIIPQAID